MGARHHQGHRPLRRALCATAGAVLALSSVAVPAHANAFGNVFNDYKKHGSVSACSHSTAELKRAKHQVPPDIAQYAPDFPAAIDAALAQRARGGCAKGSSGGPAGSGSASGATGPGAPTGGTAAPPASTSGSSATPAPPAPTSSPPNISFHSTSAVRRGSGDTPAPLIIVAAIAAALALPALAWAFARWRGWEPLWLPGMRHALGEASFRAGNGWAEFADWLRLGH